MNLLLTSSTTPDFGPDALDLGNKFCIADWMPGGELVRYLLLAPASEFASIDAIVFLEPNMSVGLLERPDESLTAFPEMTPWETHYCNLSISERIRNLPETCSDAGRA